MSEICEGRSPRQPGLIECLRLTRFYGKSAIITERECDLCQTSEGAHLHQISTRLDKELIDGEE